MCADYGVDPAVLNGKLFIFTLDDGGFKLNRPGGSEQLDKMLAWIKREAGQMPVLVVTDTSREAISGSVSKEEDVSPFLDAARAAARNGPAVVLVCHQSQEAGKQQIEDRTPKGLTDFTDRAQWVVTKSADVAQGMAYVYALKIKNAPARWKMVLSVTQIEGRIPRQSRSIGSLPAAVAQPSNVRERAKNDPRPDPEFAEQVDEALVDELKRSNGAWLSTGNLAQRLAHRGDIDQAESSLRRTIRTLSVDKRRRAHMMFHPNRSSAQGQWHYREPAGGSPFAPVATSRRSDRAQRTEAAWSDANAPSTGSVQ